MKAVHVTKPGNVDVQVVVDDFPLPELRARDVLVDVKSVGVNPIDYKARDGMFGPKQVVGYDFAGVVSAVGPEVSLFKVGDEVWGAGDITRLGSYAEKLAIDERIISLKPRSLSFVEASVLPLAALTAFEIFEEQFHLQDVKVR
jgi:NADPH:quinone reductase